MKVLVFNFGSSSIKYELFDMRDRTTLATGLLERIGEAESRLCHRFRNGGGEFDETIDETPVADHRQGMDRIGAILQKTKAYQDPSELYGIGHRLAHGGEAFREPTLIDEAVLETVRGLTPLAPLHNPVMVAGMELALASFPGVPQVAVFDTAFHHTIPPYVYHYAVPRELYRSCHVRQYGFHGTSLHYVAKRAARYLDRPFDSLNQIVLHLGNGASAGAIHQGKSMDTSMGMTPLSGLVMGTRCGDLDPAIVFHVARLTGWSNEQIEAKLNKESGLKGICGDNDMRVVEQRAEAGDEAAQLAIDMYAHRTKKYIGAYYAVLGHVDALVFTAGIGENSPLIRARACEGLENLGIVIDPERNSQRSDEVVEIHADSSSVKVLVVPTDEELEIAEQTVERIQHERGAANL